MLYFQFDKCKRKKKKELIILYFKFNGSVSKQQNARILKINQ